MSASQLSVSSEMALCGRYIATITSAASEAGDGWISKRRCARPPVVGVSIDGGQRRGVALCLARLRSNVVAGAFDGGHDLGPAREAGSTRTVACSVARFTFASRRPASLRGSARFD